VASGAFTYPPVPVLTFTCPVSTCWVETGFVAVSGVIWMLASTHVLIALGPSPALPSPVARVNVSSSTTTAVLACTVSTPGVAELPVTEPAPVPPAVTQLDADKVPTCAPTNAKLITVPSGALAYPPTHDALTGWHDTFTCPVNVCTVAPGGITS